MNKNTGPYHVVDFPPERRFMANLLHFTWADKHSSGEFTAQVAGGAAGKVNGLRTVTPRESSITPTLPLICYTGSEA
jgi:hypothetical protein